MKITFDFIPLSERFPEKSGTYQVITKYSCIDLPFSYRHLAFNAYDFFGEIIVTKRSLNDEVIAWAEIPQELEDWRETHDENV